MRKNSLFIILLPSLLLLFSCGNRKGKDNTLFSLLDSTATGISFTNTVTDNEADNCFRFRNFYNGGGVGLGDINNDGLADVVLTSNMGENKVYLNKGGMKFEDITAKTGFRQDSMWSTGVTMVDINNDGWLDIYICNSGRINDGHRLNKLYINNHNLTFTEQAKAYGLDHSGFCTQASFFDYDLDGDLDCLLINNSPLPFSSLNYGSMRDASVDQWKVNEELKGGGNHLYRNEQNFFTEVTREAGLHTGLISFGLGVSIGDLNNDGYPDIYVGNDFIEKDYLYINQQNGTFRDELEDRVQHISMSSMSTDLADINNDGHPDIFTTDMIPDDDYRLKTTGTFDNIDLYNSKLEAGLYHQYVRNALQVNDGTGHFTEIANYANVFGTDWSWGALFLDADNDGRNDIFVCNGINRDLTDLDFLDFFSNDVYRESQQQRGVASISEMLKKIPVTPLPNRVFQNKGRFEFADMGNQWGFDTPTFSNSVAYADLDNDGDLDLVVNNENQPSFVYRNNSREQSGNNYVALKLKGSKDNVYAIGTKIRVYSGDQLFTRDISPSRGFQSSVDYKQVIGLGAITKIDSVELIWPDRTYSRFYNVKPNELHEYIQPAQTGPLAYTMTAQAPVWFTADSSGFIAHQEDPYIDFYYERNLPELLSKEGPAMSVADVNGDGREDVFVGGAKGQLARLYEQQPDGSLRVREQAAFGLYADLEDVASVFFDADKDGDMDLFVGAGGNYMEAGSRESQHRLFKNDGKGNFTLDPQALPNNDMNIAVAVHYDYDGDGDEDLYVGSRSVPFQYGTAPKSYLYNNDGQGHFTDVADQLSATLSHQGMITGAEWTDMTGDGQKELVIVGEWIAPVIYTYNKQSRKLEELKKTGLEELYGWWQTVKAADLNGDGKTDLVLGNIGENFYLRPDEARPVSLWLNDFDKTGTLDHFLTRRIDGKDMPVFLKREITDQFPFLKKDNLLHSAYAKKDIKGLFGEELVNKARQLQFNYCPSVIAWNEGNRKFRLEKLPVEAQLSSLNAVAVMDINNDKQPDLVLGGNKFGFPPQFGRLDANQGQLLINAGKGQFRVVTGPSTGMYIRDEVKQIIPIQLNKENTLIMAINNRKPVIYRLKK
jgi:hypothetical protein